MLSSSSQLHRARLFVFDLDHTLLTCNSSYEFGFFLYQKGYFGWGNLIRCLSYYACHKWLGTSVESLHRQSFAALFKGRSDQQLRAYSQEFLDKRLTSMINPPILELLQEAQKQGHACVIFSGSPDFIIKPIARKWGIEQGSEGTQYQVNERGQLSHVSRIMEGTEKANALKSLLIELNFQPAEVTAYSDSILDLPLLQMVGKVVAVNPDAKLRQACHTYHWSIIEQAKR